MASPSRRLLCLVLAFSTFLLPPHSLSSTATSACPAGVCGARADCDDASRKPTHFAHFESRSGKRSPAFAYAPVKGAPLAKWQQRLLAWHGGRADGRRDAKREQWEGGMEEWGVEVGSEGSEGSEGGEGGSREGIYEGEVVGESGGSGRRMAGKKESDGLGEWEHAWRTGGGGDGGGTHMQGGREALQGARSDSLKGVAWESDMGFDLHDSLLDAFLPVLDPLRLPSLFQSAAASSASADSSSSAMSAAGVEEDVVKAGGFNFAVRTADDAAYGAGGAGGVKEKRGGGDGAGGGEAQNSNEEQAARERGRQLKQKHSEQVGQRGKGEKKQRAAAEGGGVAGLTELSSAVMSGSLLSEAPLGSPVLLRVAFAAGPKAGLQQAQQQQQKTAPGGLSAPFFRLSSQVDLSQSRVQLYGPMPHSRRTTYPLAVASAADAAGGEVLTANFTVKLPGAYSVMVVVADTQGNRLKFKAPNFFRSALPLPSALRPASSPSPVSPIVLTAVAGQQARLAFELVSADGTQVPVTDGDVIIASVTAASGGNTSSSSGEASGWVAGPSAVGVEVDGASGHIILCFTPPSHGDYSPHLSLIRPHQTLQLQDPPPSASSASSASASSPLPPSASVVQVAPGDPSADTTGPVGLALQAPQEVTVGQTGRVTVRVRDAMGNDVPAASLLPLFSASFSVSSNLSLQQLTYPASLSSPASNSTSPVNPSLLEVTFDTGTLAGAASLAVLLSGHQISGSPFPFTLLPGPLRPAASLLYGPGAHGATPNQTAYLQVQLRDEWGNVLGAAGEGLDVQVGVVPGAQGAAAAAALVTGSGGAGGGRGVPAVVEGAAVSVVDSGGGCYSIAYRVPSAGPYALLVTVGDVLLQNVTVAATPAVDAGAGNAPAQPTTVVTVSPASGPVQQLLAFAPPLVQSGAATWLRIVAVDAAGMAAVSDPSLTASNLSLSLLSTQGQVADVTATPVIPSFGGKPVPALWEAQVTVPVAGSFVLICVRCLGRASSMVVKSGLPLQLLPAHGGAAGGNASSPAAPAVPAALAAAAASFAVQPEEQSDGIALAAHTHLHRHKAASVDTGSSGINPASGGSGAVSFDPQLSIGAAPFPSLSSNQPKATLPSEAPPSSSRSSSGGSGHSGTSSSGSSSSTSSSPHGRTLHSAHTHAAAATATAAAHTMHNPGTITTTTAATTTAASRTPLTTSRSSSISSSSGSKSSGSISTTHSSSRQAASGVQRTDYTLISGTSGAFSLTALPGSTSPARSSLALAQAPAFGRVVVVGGAVRLPLRAADSSNNQQSYSLSRYPPSLDAFSVVASPSPACAPPQGQAVPVVGDVAFERLQAGSFDAELNFTRAGEYLVQGYLGEVAFGAAAERFKVLPGEVDPGQSYVDGGDVREVQAGTGVRMRLVLRDVFGNTAIPYHLLLPNASFSAHANSVADSSSTATATSASPAAPASPSPSPSPPAAVQAPCSVVLRAANLTTRASWWGGLWTQGEGGVAGSVQSGGSADGQEEAGTVVMAAAGGGKRAKPEQQGGGGGAAGDVGGGVGADTGGVVPEGVRCVWSAACSLPLCQALSAAQSDTQQPTAAAAAAAKVGGGAANGCVLEVQFQAKQAGNWSVTVLLEGSRKKLLSPVPLLEVLPGPPSAVNSSVQLLANTVAAGSPPNVSVVARDALGNEIRDFDPSTLLYAVLPNASSFSSSAPAANSMSSSTSVPPRSLQESQAGAGSSGDGSNDDSNGEVSAGSVSSSSVSGSGGGNMSGSGVMDASAMVPAAAGGQTPPLVAHPVVHALGPATVQVYLAGQPVPGATFPLTVLPAPPSPALSYAFGPGLERTVAGAPSSFTLQTRTAQGLFPGQATGQGGGQQGGWTQLAQGGLGDGNGSTNGSGSSSSSAWGSSATFRDGTLAVIVTVFARRNVSRQPEVRSVAAMGGGAYRITYVTYEPPHGGFYRVRVQLQTAGSGEAAADIMDGPFFVPFFRGSAAAAQSTVNASLYSTVSLPLQQRLVLLVTTADQFGNVGPYNPLMDSLPVVFTATPARSSSSSSSSPPVPATPPTTSLRDMYNGSCVALFSAAQPGRYLLSIKIAGYFVGGGNGPIQVDVSDSAANNATAQAVGGAVGGALDAAAAGAVIVDEPDSPAAAPAAASPSTLPRLLPGVDALLREAESSAAAAGSDAWQVTAGKWRVKGLAGGGSSLYALASTDFLLVPDANTDGLSDARAASDSPLSAPLSWDILIQPILSPPSAFNPSPDPTRPAARPAAIQPQYDGTCRVAFTPPAPGAFLLSVRLFSQHVPGSPFLLSSLPGPVAPERCEVWGNGMGPAVTAGKAVRVRVRARDGQGIVRRGRGDLFTLQLFGDGVQGGYSSQLLQPAASGTAQEQGVYEAEYEAVRAGRVALWVVFHNTIVATAAVSVLPAPPSANSSAVLAPEGGLQVRAGEAVEVLVALRDDLGNVASFSDDAADNTAAASSQLAVTLLSSPLPAASPAPKFTAKTIQPALLALSAPLTTAGLYQLQVKLNGAPLSSPPLSLRILPAPPASFSLSGLPPAASFPVARPIVVRVTLRDRFGNAVGQEGEAGQVGGSVTVSYVDERTGGVVGNTYELNVTAVNVTGADAGAWQGSIASSSATAAAFSPASTAAAFSPASTAAAFSPASTAAAFSPASTAAAFSPASTAAAARSRSPTTKAPATPSPSPSPSPTSPSAIPAWQLTFTPQTPGQASFHLTAGPPDAPLPLTDPATSLPPQATILPRPASLAHSSLFGAGLQQGGGVRAGTVVEMGVCVRDAQGFPLTPDAAQLLKVTAAFAFFPLPAPTPGSLLPVPAAASLPRARMGYGGGCLFRGSFTPPSNTASLSPAAAAAAATVAAPYGLSVAVLVNSRPVRFQTTNITVFATLPPNAPLPANLTVTAVTSDGVPIPNGFQLRSSEVGSETKFGVRFTDANGTAVLVRDDSALVLKLTPSLDAQDPDPSLLFGAAVAAVGGKEGRDKVSVSVSRGGYVTVTVVAAASRVPWRNVHYSTADGSSFGWFQLLLPPGPAKAVRVEAAPLLACERGACVVGRRTAFSMSVVDAHGAVRSFDRVTGRGDKLTVTLTRLPRNEVVFSAPATVTSEGNYLGSFLVDEPGNFTAEVQLNNKTVYSVPVHVMAGPFSPSLSRLHDLSATAVAGQPYRFNVSLRDSLSNPYLLPDLPLLLHTRSPSSEADHGLLLSSSPTLSASITVFESGPARLSVTHLPSAAHLWGSPYTFTVLPGPVAASACSLQGLENGTLVGSNQTFLVVARDSYQNPIEYPTAGESGLTVNVTFVPAPTAMGGSGSATAVVQPVQIDSSLRNPALPAGGLVFTLATSAAGTYSVSVKVGPDHVMGSPTDVAVLPPAPSARLLASFDRSQRALSVSFSPPPTLSSSSPSPPTNSGGTPGGGTGGVGLSGGVGEQACSEVLDAQTMGRVGSGAQCIWQNPSHLLLYLGFNASLLPFTSLTASSAPNSTISFLPSLSPSSSSSASPSLPPNTSVSVGIAPPGGANGARNPLEVQESLQAVPVVVAALEAAGTVGICDHLLLDASGSKSIYGAPLSFTWRVFSPLESLSLDLLLSSQGVAASKVTIPPNTLAPGATYMFAVFVMDPNGRAANASLLVTQSPSAVPSLRIIAPASSAGLRQLSPRPGDSLTIPSLASLPDSSCLPSSATPIRAAEAAAAAPPPSSASSPAAASALLSLPNASLPLSFTWSLVAGPPLNFSLPALARSQHSPALTIPPSTLLPGATYVLSLEATSAADPAARAVDYVAVRVGASPLRVAIVGGDRLVAVGQPLQLQAVVVDADEARDSGGKPLPIQYSWGCERLTAAQAKVPVTAQAWAAASSSSTGSSSSSSSGSSSSAAACFPSAATVLAQSTSSLTIPAGSLTPGAAYRFSLLVSRNPLALPRTSPAALARESVPAVAVVSAEDRAVPPAAVEVAAAWGRAAGAMGEWSPGMGGGAGAGAGGGVGGSSGNDGSNSTVAVGAGAAGSTGGADSTSSNSASGGIAASTGAGGTSAAIKSAGVQAGIAVDRSLPVELQCVVTAMPYAYAWKQVLPDGSLLDLNVTNQPLVLSPALLARGDSCTYRCDVYSLPLTPSSSSLASSLTPDGQPATAIPSPAPDPVTSTSLTIPAAKAAWGGSFAAQQVAGDSSGHLFALSAPGWTAMPQDLPLSYTFGTLSPSSSSSSSAQSFHPLTLPSSSASTTAILPPGSLSLALQVASASGALTQTTLPQPISVPARGSGGAPGGGSGEGSGESSSGLSSQEWLAAVAAPAAARQDGTQLLQALAAWSAVYRPNASSNAAATGAAAGSGSNSSAAGAEAEMLIREVIQQSSAAVVTPQYAELAACSLAALSPLPTTLAPSTAAALVDLLDSLTSATEGISSRAGECIIALTSDLLALSPTAVASSATPPTSPTAPSPASAPPASAPAATPAAAPVATPAAAPAAATQSLSFTQAVSHTATTQATSAPQATEATSSKLFRLAARVAAAVLYRQTPGAQFQATTANVNLVAAKVRRMASPSPQGEFASALPSAALALNATDASLPPGSPYIAAFITFSYNHPLGLSSRVVGPPVVVRAVDASLADLNVSATLTMLSASHASMEVGVAVWNGSSWSSAPIRQLSSTTDPSGLLPTLTASSSATSNASSNATFAAAYPAAAYPSAADSAASSAAFTVALAAAAINGPLPPAFAPYVLRVDLPPLTLPPIPPPPAVEQGMSLLTVALAVSLPIAGMIACMALGLELNRRRKPIADGTETGSFDSEHE